MNHRAPDKRGGFSLLEVLIVIAIASTVVLVASNLSSNVSLLNGLITQQLQSRSNTDQLLQVVTANIQSAEPSAAGAYPIDTASTNTFAFYAVIGGGSAVHIRYFLASSSIYEGVTAPTGSPAVYETSTMEVVTDLVNDVTTTTSTPLFTYYDTSYTGTQSPLSSTTDLSAIRLVGISFYITAATSSSITPQYYSTLADIRELRSN